MVKLGLAEIFHCLCKVREESRLTVIMCVTTKLWDESNYQLLMRQMFGDSEPQHHSVIWQKLTQTAVTSGCQARKVCREEQKGFCVLGSTTRQCWAKCTPAEFLTCLSAKRKTETQPEASINTVTKRDMLLVWDENMKRSTYFVLGSGISYPYNSFLAGRQRQLSSFQTQRHQSLSSPELKWRT